MWNRGIPWRFCPTADSCAVGVGWDLPGILYFWQRSGWCLCCWPQPSLGAESCSQHTMSPCPHPSLLFIILPRGNLVYPQAAPNYVWARFSARPWEYVCEALANPYFYFLVISLAQGSASKDCLEPATWLCPLVLCPSHPQRCYEPNVLSMFYQGRLDS